MKKSVLLFTFLSTFSNLSYAQCVANNANIHTFKYSGRIYELVKENKNWVDAAACAVARGGKLAEINSQQEQDSVFHHVGMAGIAAANTVAPDGGGASYVWLGGTDRSTEGAWLWNGSNLGSTLQFWQGTSSGMAVGGQYTNWGNEPDNWNNQDCLGLAITNWPLGIAGQWNDVMESNQLYYIIEYAGIPTSVQENEKPEFVVYPNPADHVVSVKAVNQNSPIAYSILDAFGKTVVKGTLHGNETRIDVSSLAPGIYTLFTEGVNRQAYKLVKQ